MKARERKVKCLDIGIIINTKKNSSNNLTIMKSIKTILSRYNIKEIIIDYDITDNKNMLRAIDELRSVCMIISVGGDGTLLSALKVAIKYDVPVLPIYNGTLGFIAEIEPDEGYQILEDYINKNNKLYFIGKRVLLSLTLKTKKNNKQISKSYYAVNDVVIGKSAGRPVGLNIKISDSSSDVKLIGDGLIIATPTGSTAYALSVGGPIMFHSINAIAFVPIAPHSLTFRPLIIPKENSISIKLENGYTTAGIVLDGDYIHELLEDDTIMIKASNKYCYIIQSKNRSFYDILRDKLNWGV